MTDTTPQPRTAEEEFAQRRRNIGQRIQHLVHRHPWASPLTLLIIAVAVFSTLNPLFGTPGNLSLVVQQSAVVAAVAAAQALVLISGGIDLSVGALMVLTTLVAAKLSAEAGVPGPFALLLGGLLGAGLGAINGTLVALLRLNPFVVTLGTWSVFAALVTLVSGGVGVDGGSMDPFLTWTASSIVVGGFTVTAGMVVVAALYLVLGYALLMTSWGRHVFAVGDDPEASRLVAIRVTRVRFGVYVVVGVILAVAGWVLMGRTGGASPQTGLSVNLDSITAAVIGGTSLAGGRGSIMGAVIGSVLVSVFRNGLFLAGVDVLFQNLAVGVLTIVAVGLDQWIKKVRA